MAQSLADRLPYYFTQGEYDHTRAYRYRDVEVVREYSLNALVHWQRWPGKRKNVQNWFVLANGYAVGWNEGTQGNSFEVIKAPKDS